MFRRTPVRFDSLFHSVSKLSTNHRQAQNLGNAAACTPCLLNSLDNAHVIATLGLNGIKPTEVPHNRPVKADGLGEALQNRLTTSSSSAKMSSSTQAQADIDSLLQKLPMLKDLPPLSHMNISKQSSLPTHHRWLLNLGTLNGETIWCGLGPPRNNPDQAPQIYLHLGKIGVNMPHVRSKELENVAYVEPFKTLWQKIEKLESSDEKRGRIKGLTHWYFLQQAADKGEHFKVYESIRHYILRTMKDTPPIVQTKSGTNVSEKVVDIINEQNREIDPLAKWKAKEAKFHKDKEASKNLEGEARKKMEDHVTAKAGETTREASEAAKKKNRKEELLRQLRDLNDSEYICSVMPEEEIQEGNSMVRGKHGARTSVQHHSRDDKKDDVTTESHFRGNGQISDHQDKVDKNDERDTDEPPIYNSCVQTTVPLTCNREQGLTWKPFRSFQKLVSQQEPQESCIPRKQFPGVRQIEQPSTSPEPEESDETLAVKLKTGHFVRHSTASRYMHLLDREYHDPELNQPADSEPAHRPPVLRNPSFGHELHLETSRLQVDITQKELIFDLLKGDFEEYESLKRKCEALNKELQETKRAAVSKKNKILQFVGVAPNGENWQ